MLHEISNMSNFNIPDSLFTKNSFHICYSKMGGVRKDGFESPNGGSSISSSKKVAFAKSHSEYLERRLLMTGSSNKKQVIKSLNLITGKKEMIPNKISTYSESGPNIIDTTGTATHYNSSIAIYNALKELLEKNALFLFWYGGIGYRLQVNKRVSNTIYYKALRGFKRKVLFFISSFFQPLNVVFTIVLENEEIYSCGIGSAIDIGLAIEHSVKEAVLLGSIDTMNEQIQSNKSKVNINRQKMPKKQLLNLFRIPNYCISVDQKINNIENKSITNSINHIISRLPKWLESLYIILLRNPGETNKKTIKVFSYELYNHVPFKDKILLDRKINLKTVNLGDNELKLLPDTIFI